MAPGTPSRVTWRRVIVGANGRGTGSPTASASTATAFARAWTGGRKPSPVTMETAASHHTHRGRRAAPATSAEGYPGSGVRVRLVGERARLDLVGEGPHGPGDLPAKVRVGLDELRVAALAEPHEVVEHQDLAVAGGPRADPDRRDRDRLGHPAGHVRGDPLEHQREDPRLLQRLRLGQEPLGGLVLSGLDPVAAHGVDRL